MTTKGTPDGQNDYWNTLEHLHADMNRRMLLLEHWNGAGDDLCGLTLLPGAALSDSLGRPHLPQEARGAV
jgi:hypothetical protein